MFLCENRNQLDRLEHYVANISAYFEHNVGEVCLKLRFLCK
ncbi:hypothetical protein F3D3_1836 [Fusibacter sp. 3D3]|nr:hypothetical protein F3D3_1836 [Fusibacter sp. 3D3]